MSITFKDSIKLGVGIAVGSFIVSFSLALLQVVIALIASQL